MENQNNSMLNSIINSNPDNQDIPVQPQNTTAAWSVDPLANLTQQSSTTAPQNQMQANVNQNLAEMFQTAAAANPQPQQPQTPPPPKPPVKKKTTWDFMRIFWSIFLSWIVLFSAFIAYIVFNPDQAQFFISLWINPQDIKNLLEKLVNITFGLLTLFLSTVSLIYLFRAFFTKKEFAKKKTVAIILSIFFIIILMAQVTLWAFLVKMIWATDYVNPNWWVIIYDNDKSKSEKFNDWKDIINNFENLIWPVSMRFDLEADARYVSKYIDITWFQIDFDWDWKVDKQWINPLTDKWIIFTYEKKWSYTPTWRYIWKDKVAWKPKEVEMKLPNINIAWIIKLTQKADRAWWKRAFFDLADIKQLWRVDFYFSDSKWEFANPDTTYDWTDKFSPQQTFKSETLVCILIKNNQKSKDNCDKMLIVWDEWQSNFGWEIIEERDPANPLAYNFSFKPSDNNIVISWYEWVVDKNQVVWTDEMVEYSFIEYWKHEVKLTIKLANWTDTTIYKDIRITKPITLATPAWVTPYTSNNSLLRITDEAWKNVIDWTWQRDLNLYHIKVWLPIKLNFDASFVKTKETWYNLKKVEWDLNDDGKADKVWDKIQFEFLEDKKHTFNIIYYFESDIKKDKQVVWEKVVVEAWKKAIDVVLKFTQDSEYAPTVVHFDGSASSAKDQQITKFTYDFWEGREVVDWDAKQDYKYKFAWEYKVTFTVTTEDWKKESTTQKVILKEKWKDVTINSSVSSWYVWKNIDFDSAWTIWQIESYLWDFWDGTTSTDPIAMHSFNSAGEFKVKLTITYSDWVVKTWDKYITIK